MRGTDLNLLGLEAMIMGNQAIELQEKRGQQELIHNCELPRNMGGFNSNYEEYKALLNSIGIEIVNEDTNDDLFIQVKLPDGWKKEYTDHSMWSNLLDDKGRKRASIFYKAAFYDRDAFIRFNRRFNLSFEIADYNKKDFEEKPKYIKDGFEKVLVNTETGERVTSIETIINEFGCCESYINANGEEEFIEYDERDWDDFGWRKKASYQYKELPKYKKNPDYVPMTGYEKYSQPFHYEVHDYDDTIIFKSDIVKTDFEYCNKRHREFFNHRDSLVEKCKQQCIDWLNENYPEWKSELSYWD